MKILGVIPTSKLKLGEVEPGDVFRTSDKDYLLLCLRCGVLGNMSMPEISKLRVACARLVDGFTFTLPDDTEVEIIDCVVKVNNSEVEVNDTEELVK